MPDGGDDLSAESVDGGDATSPHDAPASPQMPVPPHMPTAPGQVGAAHQPVPAPPQMPAPPKPSSPAGLEPTVAQSRVDDDDALLPGSVLDESGQPDDQVVDDAESAGRVAVTPSVAAPGLAAAAPEQGDWLDRICPYLLSEDGSYRSTQPDEGHRCTAQDPPGTLPLAFQERFCLTDQHVRCEMFKYAQSVRSAALEDGGIPVEQVQGARFKPSVRSVPVALGPSGSGDSSARSSRNILIGAAAIGGAILFILVVILLSGGGGGAPGESPTPDPGATTAATVPATLGPTPQVTPAEGATERPETSPTTDAGTQLIQYQVQEGEALLKIADYFGTSRRNIIRANEGMADKTPYAVTGDIILIPADAAMTVEELEAFPGYVGPAE